MRYGTIEKNVGETPLQATERFRKLKKISKETPLAYAGRLDPMASGVLLILIGEECKKQSDYHALDKEYTFQVIFGLESDTGDVLGIIESKEDVPIIDGRKLAKITESFKGEITLPYPHFSSKTVAGKPLHVWTLEGRLDEIEIPTYTATIYNLELRSLEQKVTEDIFAYTTHKISLLPKVTEASKALGRDFRRRDVLASWEAYKNAYPGKIFSIATFVCTASSGLYMRSLAEVIAKQFETTGLALSIHRNKIGTYTQIGPFSFWLKSY